MARVDEGCERGALETAGYMNYGHGGTAAIQHHDTFIVHTNMCQQRYVLTLWQCSRGQFAMCGLQDCTQFGPVRRQVAVQRHKGCPLHATGLYTMRHIAGCGRQTNISKSHSCTRLQRCVQDMQKTLGFRLVANYSNIMSAKLLCQSSLACKSLQHPRDATHRRLLFPGLNTWPMKQCLTSQCNTKQQLSHMAGMQSQQQVGKELISSKATRSRSCCGLLITPGPTTAGAVHERIVVDSHSVRTA
jgi:hypothetical protein